MKSRVFFMAIGILFLTAGGGMAQTIYLGHCGTSGQKECPNLNQLEQCRGGDPRWLLMNQARPSENHLAMSHGDGSGGWRLPEELQIVTGTVSGDHVWGVQGADDQYIYNTHLKENPPAPANTIPMLEVNPGGKLAYLQENGIGIWLFPWEDPPPLPEPMIYTQSDLDEAVEAERNKWDVDGDGKIGLAEAIRALQVLTSQ